MEIVWLGQGNCHDCTLVGGKGANLCHLAATQRIPPAFCLTAAALRDRQPGTGETPAALPPALYLQLAAAYEQLSARCGRTDIPVAVRSSALDEDGHAFSFAGQHSTYLNVTGLANVAQAIQQCWASADSAHVLAYRQRHGLPTTAIRMAVLVQQLIPADLSAVVFSAHPITGQQDVVIINVSWGLGESIVSGAVTPDIVLVRKHDLIVLDYQVADKRTMVVPVAPGTQALPTPRWLRTQPALTSAQIEEVTQLALRLEAHMGWPVDIECSYRAGLLYLLQCRPITHRGVAATGD